MVGQLSVPGLYACTVIGALVIGAMVAWHGVYLMGQVRRALPSRFGVTIRFYIVAALLLPLGALLGAMVAYPSLNGTLHSQFLLAHEAVNVLGFVAVSYTHLDVYKRQGGNPAQPRQPCLIEPRLI